MTRPLTLNMLSTLALIEGLGLKESIPNHVPIILLADVVFKARCGVPSP